MYSPRREALVHLALSRVPLVTRLGFGNDINAAIGESIKSTILLSVARRLVFEATFGI